MKPETKIKAVALVSMGLDSMLAAKVVQNLGIDVLALHCRFRFDPTSPEDIAPVVHATFDPLHIPVHIVNVTELYMKMMLDPPHGYGKGVNPCIDCKIFFFREAKKIMEEIGAQFIVTGEVVGQRPMSQMRNTLRHIEKCADLKDFVVRPLCAKNLDPTIPEKNDWINRDKLYNFSGRSRKGQMGLAKELGIHEYQQPAGGCVLTSPQYAKRAKILFKHRDRGAITLPDLEVLRLGRHLWPSENLHVIVGRHEEENELLEKYRNGRLAFEPAHFGGPLVLAEGVTSSLDVRLVAQICARYSGKKAHPSCVIGYKSNSEQGDVEVEPIESGLTEKWVV